VIAAGGYDVLVALVLAVPGILAAIFAGIVALRTRMPNGSRLGASVAQTSEAIAENRELLVKLNGIYSRERP
jgi:hypothetical protein